MRVCYWFVPVYLCKSHTDGVGSAASPAIPGPQEVATGGMRIEALGLQRCSAGRALAALPEDMGSLPCTHMATPNLCYSSSTGSIALFRTPQALYTRGTKIYMQAKLAHTWCKIIMKKFKIQGLPGLEN